VLGVRAQGAPDPDARRRDRVCKQRGVFAGTRLQDGKAVRSWAEDDPARAEGGALSPRARVSGRS